MVKGKVERRPEIWKVGDLSIFIKNWTQGSWQGEITLDGGSNEGSRWQQQWGDSWIVETRHACKGIINMSSNSWIWGHHKSTPYSCKGPEWDATKEALQYMAFRLPQSQMTRLSNLSKGLPHSFFSAFSFIIQALLSFFWAAASLQCTL